MARADSSRPIVARRTRRRAGERLQAAEETPQVAGEPSPPGETPVATPRLQPEADSFPHLRLREPAGSLLDLPWEKPLGAWPATELGLRQFLIGPSRHLVRFIVRDDTTYALKEEPLEPARHEYEVLRRLESMTLPSVTAVGLAEAPERDTAILVTEYLGHSLQYRRLMMRLPAGAYRDRLLDAMAWLLVDLHRSGVYWGDCSLANTLFRRDGDRLQAYLVDAETSSVYPELSTGQRAEDLEVLVENVAFGLADLALMQGRPEEARRRHRLGRGGPPALPRAVEGAHGRAAAGTGRPSPDPGPRQAPQRPGVRGGRDRPHSR